MPGERPRSAGRVGALIVAAGRSLRMQGADKMFSPLAGMPLLLHTLSGFQASPRVDDIVLVLREDAFPRVEALLAEHGRGKVRALQPGGARRQDSVRRGLEALAGCDWVLVHDGARPLVDACLVGRALDAARETGAAVPVVAPKDTVKETGDGSLVRRTLPRDSLRLAQTPQAFRRELLWEAHRSVVDDVTDDAAMVECLGRPVMTFEGSYSNIKITTPEDLAMAEALLRAGRKGSSGPCA